MNWSVNPAIYPHTETDAETNLRCFPFLVTLNSWSLQKSRCQWLLWWMWERVGGMYLVALQGSEGAMWSSVRAHAALSPACMAQKKQKKTCKRILLLFLFNKPHISQESNPRIPTRLKKHSSHITWSGNIEPNLMKKTVIFLPYHTLLKLWHF